RQIPIGPDLAAQPGEQELLAGIHQVHPELDVLLRRQVVGDARRQFGPGNQLSGHGHSSATYDTQECWGVTTGKGRQTGETLPADAESNRYERRFAMLKAKQTGLIVAATCGALLLAR